MAATRRRVNAVAPTYVYPDAVVFEERDGIYWLRGPGLALARKALALLCQGEAVGFDHVTATLYAQSLLGKRVKVAFCKNGMIRTLALRPRYKLPPPMGKALWLATESLVGSRELQRLHELTGHERSSFSGLVERMNAAILDGRELGTVYVYEVAAGWYEVDWELTAMSERNFEALVVAAYHTGRQLPCLLVPPKPRRGKVSLVGQASLVIEEPRAFGQLRLAI